MKKIITCFLFIAALNINISAQDLVVTALNDSLNCKITKVERDYIHFTFLFEGKVKETLLPKDRIVYYEKSFFPTSDLSEEDLVSQRGYSRIRINVTGGYSHLTAPLSDNVPSYFHDYMNQLRHGFHLAADAGYFFTESLGAGVKFAYFKTSNEHRGVAVYDDVTGEVRSGKVADDITIQYIGPAFISRFFSANKKFQLCTGLSVCYVDYRNEAIFIDSFELTGNTIALIADLGGDIRIWEGLSVGIGVSLSTAVINQFRVNDGTTTQTVDLDDDNGDNISHFDVSLGLRWNFWNQ